MCFRAAVMTAHHALKHFRALENCASSFFPAACTDCIPTMTEARRWHQLPQHFSTVEPYLLDPRDPPGSKQKCSAGTGASPIWGWW